jgi:hypothetical protein
VARARGGTASRRGRKEKRHGVQERPEKGGRRELLPAVEQQWRLHLVEGGRVMEKVGERSG